MRSDAQKRADRKYESKIFCMTSLKTKKEICLNSRIERAAQSLNMSKNSFLLYAIEKELTRLGYERPQTNTDNE